MEWKRRRLNSIGSLSRAKYGISCRITASVLDLPTCLLIDIFSRLPVTTILSCKRVCKAWYTFFSSETDFANVYLSNPPFSSIVMSFGKSAFCFLELKADYNYCLPRNSPKIFRIPDGINEWTVTLFGSSNGLLCFSAYSLNKHEYKVYLCNPLLGEYAMLPLSNVEEKDSKVAYGFGFSPKTGEYKVFRILNRKWNPGKTEAQVCTIGLDNDWRVLKESAPLPHARQLMDRIYDRYRICEVTVNGALHWITDYMITGDFLYSFDIGDEKIQPVPQPRGMVVGNGRVSLGVLRGCLCIYQIAFPPVLDIWSMKEYGVVESWTKESIMESCIPPRMYRSLYLPVVIWRAGEMFMCTEYGHLFSYSLEEKRSTIVSAYLAHDHYRFAVPYAPCFLSLKNIVKAGKEQGVDTELNFVLEQNNIKDASAIKHWSTTTGIRDLPIFILVNIFSRVPSSTVISIKCVCRTWYNLISDPHFADSYFTTQKSVSLVLSNRDSICSFLELKTDCHCNAQPNIEKILETPAQFSNKRVTFIGSCNGLICLSKISHSVKKCKLYIFNPQLREYTMLPKLKIYKTCEDVYGFGYCPATGHYKVLRFHTTKRQPKTSEAQVHTIGIDYRWRTIWKCRLHPVATNWPKDLSKARFCGVTLKGALHWMVEDSHDPYFIYSFDMEEEDVHPIPSPPIIGGRGCWTSLGVLRDFLCVFHGTSNLNFDIWWMRDYGVVNSWTKESVLASYIPVGLKAGAFLPLFVWRNDEILMSTDHGALVSYCPRDSKCTVLKIEHNAGGYLTAAPHFSSFLSLKAAMKGVDLKVVKVK
ncbi:uncharacterized protein [Coffea arabica]|uniref:F-box domain-containing protein n=1 Tax=Coffea arabica TaxID=13443 RepID=A0A6P6V727_COFAR